MPNEFDEIKGSYDHGFAAGKAESAAEIERLRTLLQECEPCVERVWKMTMGGPNKSSKLALLKSVRSAYQQRPNMEK